MCFCISMTFKQNVVGSNHRMSSWLTSDIPETLAVFAPSILQRMKLHLDIFSANLHSFFGTNVTSLAANMDIWATSEIPAAGSEHISFLHQRKTTDQKFIKFLLFVPSEKYSVKLRFFFHRKWISRITFSAFPQLIVVIKILVSVFPTSLSMYPSYVLQIKHFKIIQRKHSLLNHTNLRKNTYSLGIFSRIWCFYSSGWE